VAKSCASVAANDAYNSRDTERRRVKALALLEQYPDWRIAVVVEAGSPAIVGVAIRSIAYGEVEIPAEQYDAFELLALMDRHGAEQSKTIH
jgi:hypothetical protein